jgi:hypothetical protein
VIFLKKSPVILSAAKDPVELRTAFGKISIAPEIDGILHFASLRSE